MAFSTVDIRNSYKAAERASSAAGDQHPRPGHAPHGARDGRPAQPPRPTLGLVRPSPLSGPRPRPALDLVWPSRLARPGASSGTSPCSGPEPWRPARQPWSAPGCPSG